MLWGTATRHVVAVALPPVVLPRGCGRCGVVVPRGAAACRVTTTALLHVSPQHAGAHRAAIAFAAHHAMALLQTEPKSEKEK